MSVTAEPISTQAPPEPAIPDVPIYRLTVEQYHEMARAGILTEDDPVELLEGLIVIKGNSTLAPAINIRAAPGSAITPPLPIRRFTVAEYHRMIAAGILTKDDVPDVL